MRILLGLDSVGGVIPTGERRQQITPDMKFTCDGIITKWIIGAKWGDGAALYPELQLWRKIGYDTYQKIIMEHLLLLRHKVMMVCMNMTTFHPSHSKLETSWECLYLHLGRAS